MMKNILVTVATNTVEQVADAPFEVHSALVWHTVENADVAQGWEYNPDDNTVVDPQVAYLASPQGQRAVMVANRMEGYGTMADQLDALYRDMRDGTTVWQEHITAVKAEFPKVNSVDPHDIDTVTKQ